MDYAETANAEVQFRFTVRLTAGLTPCKVMAIFRHQAHPNPTAGRRL